MNEKGISPALGIRAGVWFCTVEEGKRRGVLHF